MDISKDSVQRFIYTFFKTIPNSGIRTLNQAGRKSILVDNVYSCVAKTEIENILQTNPLLIPPIQNQENPEIADCDDYALQLKASLTVLYRQKMISTGQIIYPPAVGIVITQNHALNIVICESLPDSQGIYLVDPSMREPYLTENVEESVSLLKILPINTIYL